MHLTPDQTNRILRELEALDYGRLIVTVGDRGYIEITVERRVRVRGKTAPLDTYREESDNVDR